MKNIMTLLFAVLLAGGLLAAQTPPPTSGTTQRFAPGSTLRAELDKTIDAKKASAGEPVLAKTMDELKSGNEVVAPRGAKIIGHVVAATPHEKNSPSTLEIAFDKLDLGNGTEIPMKASIQALSKPQSYNMQPGGDNTGQMGPPSGGNNPMGGRGIPPGGGGMGQPNENPNPGNIGNLGAPNQNAPSGNISPNAQGVAGMSGISLSPGPAQDSVITSEKHNVKLDSGTQMILRVE
jgi:hypothetical protein